MILEAKVRYIRVVHLQMLKAVLGGNKALNIFKHKDDGCICPIDHRSTLECDRKGEAVPWSE